MGSAEAAQQLTVVGADLEVPLVGGGSTSYANLDYAASTPALTEVWEAVQAFLPWYSSVHRGAGFRSQVATAAYEGSREPVREFVGGRPNDAVIFTRNTTDSLNLLSRCLPEGTTVITSHVEHHANLLSWRRHRTLELSVPSSPDELLDRLQAALRALPPRQPALVAVTGASNVTGEIWPVAQVAALAHERGARVVVDAAQLAPHRPIDIACLDIDWVALSGHKLYAPFGAGALVGRADWLSAADPYLLGGGSVVEVSGDGAIWEGLPDRHEGGSPNVVGAVALASACRALTRVGMQAVADHERRMGDLLWRSLQRVPGLVRYVTWSGSGDRAAVSTFNLPGREHGEVAAILSAEHGIGVRNGSFCAHPLLVHLAGGGRWIPGCGLSVPGAVRASLGIGVRADDVRRLGDALSEIAERGPRWRYQRGPQGEVSPLPDDRSFPRLAFGTFGPC